MIKGNVYPASEVLKAIAKNPHIRLSLTDKGALLIGDSKIDKLNEPLPNIIKNILCFKALAYCCPLDRPCSNRDLALELLGISKTVYKNLKEEFEGKLLNYISESGIQGKSIPGKEIFYSEQPDRDILEEWDFSSLSKPENPYKNVEESKHGETDALNFFTILSGETESERRKEIYCKRCGRSVEASARYCPNCGSLIEKV